MKKALPLLFCLMLGLFKTGYAQTATISGKILDAESKDPLSGATVKVDKSKGAFSDASGRFTLTLPAGAHELTISFIGYKNEKRDITVTDGEKLVLEILLKPSAFQINPVFS